MLPVQVRVLVLIVVGTGLGYLGAKLEERLASANNELDITFVPGEGWMHCCVDGPAGSSLVRMESARWMAEAAFHISPAQASKAQEVTSLEGSKNGQNTATVSCSPR